MYGGLLDIDDLILFIAGKAMQGVAFLTGT
jgi:hypothetical protein